MTEKEYAQVIAKNLKRIAYEHDKTQAQIAQELHIHRATISAWRTGDAGFMRTVGDLLLTCHYLPRMQTKFPD